MRKVLSTIPVALLTLCAIGLTSCTDLSIGTVESNLPHKTSLSFASFQGTKTYKMSCSQDAGMLLEYSGKIENGSITISYKVNGEKTELFKLEGEQDDNGALQLQTEGLFYVILETNEKCVNGSFHFEIKK